MIESIEPFQKRLMLEHWLEDKREKAEEIKELSYSIGAFINPQMVKKLYEAEANTFASDDESFDLLSRQIIEDNRKKDAEKQQQPKKRKRKRLVK